MMPKREDTSSNWRDVSLAKMKNATHGSFLWRSLRSRVRMILPAALAHEIMREWSHGADEEPAEEDGAGGTTMEGAEGDWEDDGEEEEDCWG